MKKRMFFYFLVFAMSIFHFLIPNIIFAQSLAEQVFHEHRATILDENIRPLLPDVLRAFGKPEIQNSLTPQSIVVILNNPGVLTAIDPELDYRFVGLLTINSDLRALFRYEQFYNVLKSRSEINKLVELIEETPIPTSLEIVSGDNQHSSPNAALQPFEVVVKGLNDKPLDGILVAFSVTPVGHGKISSPERPERVRTNNMGEAQATLTLGSDPGIYQVEATVVDFPSLTQTFTAAAVGQDDDPKPTTLAIVSGNGQWGEPGKALTKPFVVVVRDQYGDPFVGDVSVTFSVTVGDGEISSPERVGTNNGGEAQATLTLGSDPGIYQVEATVVDFPSLTQTFTAAATSGQSDIAPEEVTISEIMFVSNLNGRTLPQWIELNNRSNTDVDLEGWTLEINEIFGLPAAGKEEIENPAGGTLETITTLNVQGQHRQYVQFIFPKKLIKPQETLLIASSIFDRKPKSSLPEKRVHVLKIHKLLGEAFYLKLRNKTGEPVDEVGNFDIRSNSPGWSLPKSVTEDRHRASMIRRHDAGVPRPGTEQRAWISAIKTDLVNSSTTYYGDDSDIGAPGIENGGAVPVQLSSFRAERIDAGVAITWSTESELDNAGFTIRRSKTQNDVFRSIHARLILGAGTTSEKNDYTFIDTTAEPGVIYYYQIEDISFGGVRQTLATTRLRGDFSAKGKSTTTWGSLKGQY